MSVDYIADDSRTLKINIVLNSKKFERNLNLFETISFFFRRRSASTNIDARVRLRIINSGEICTEHFVIANFLTERMRHKAINTPRLYYCFFLIQ